MISYKERPLVIISTSAASNITTQITPLIGLSELIKEFKSNPEYNYKEKLLWSIDVAAYASHNKIDLEELDPDGVFISPHKLTGGPGSCGILFFNKRVYAEYSAPSLPSGGTVDFVGGYGESDVIFTRDIHARETYGTPGVLQFIRAALAFKLQELISVEVIHKQETMYSKMIFEKVKEINDSWKNAGYKSMIRILGSQDPESRLSTFSCLLYDQEGQIIPFKLSHRVLSDFFGIQARSGCNCAGPFGILLLKVPEEIITHGKKMISQGNFETKNKYGWIRFNVHFSLTLDEVQYILTALELVVMNISNFSQIYEFENDNYHLKKIREDENTKQAKLKLHSKQTSRHDTRHTDQDYDPDTSLHHIHDAFELNLLEPLKSIQIEESDRNSFMQENIQLVYDFLNDIKNRVIMKN